jgi:histone H2A
MPGLKEEKKKAVTQNSLPTQVNKSERQTMHSRAGLMFPVARVLKKMKQGRYADRISSSSAVGVAAVLEYLTAEIIEMSGEYCLGKDKKSSNLIKPRHICLAVKNDEEMSAAIGDKVIIPMGGVIPFIHEELDKKKDLRIEKFKDDMAEEDDNSSTEDDEDEDN